MEVENDKKNKKKPTESFTADTIVAIDWNALSKRALPPGMGTARADLNLSIWTLWSPPGCNNCLLLLHSAVTKL